MGFLYTAIQPGSNPSGLPSVYGLFSTNSKAIIEQQFLYLGLGAERQDLVNGVRVYRIPDTFATTQAMPPVPGLPKDIYGVYIQVLNFKYRFTTTDPSVGFAVLREWTPIA